MNTENRTPSRLLIFGCTSFLGFDSASWEDNVVPNIPDYDVVIVSVPHITDDYPKGDKTTWVKCRQGGAELSSDGQSGLIIKTGSAELSGVLFGLKKKGATMVYLSGYDGLRPVKI